MKKLLGTLPVLVLLLTLCPAWGVELPVQAEAALLMEKETGQVLYAKNEHQALEPASVTKVMTLLLVMEAIDRGTLAYDDVVTVSDYAASMGGSQIFLSPGEQITVEDLLKGVCVSSGNDAAVALAEKTAGVTELFVEQMNNRARELGMQDTHFVNCTGLPAEGLLLAEKARLQGLEQTVTLPESAAAPVRQGDVLGTLTVTQNGETLLEVPIRAAEAVEKLTFGEMFLRLARTMCFCG